ncbi:hypothetical protein V5799_032760 [Amblyomma americanum]|uniref:Uncharacterized protein n=1 Tax=Amblyomma americanum TaxID=6943 RepID=A0AAQ4DQ91_AMBAM
MTEKGERTPEPGGGPSSSCSAPGLLRNAGASSSPGNYVNGAGSATAADVSGSTSWAPLLAADPLALAPARCLRESRWAAAAEVGRGAAAIQLPSGREQLPTSATGFLAAALDRLPAVRAHVPPKRARGPTRVSCSHGAGTLTSQAGRAAPRRSDW